jgi:cytoskeletal protein CcmA (bactofilin family)
MALLSKQNNKSQATDTTISNRILNGTEIIGDIISSGDFRIDGTVKGNVRLKGRLVAGDKSIIEGDIECSNASLSGLVKGKIQVSELLTLQATCKIQGDIVTTRLSVEPGAEFTGSCSMGVIRDIKKKDEPTEKRRSAS